jgi:hypothetical protein
MDQETTALVDDTTYKATNMMGKARKGQKKVFDYSDNEQQSENIGEGDNMGDDNINDKDVDKLHQEFEGAQEVRKFSPKRIKKLKVEKTSEPQNERLRNTTRTVHKSGKT